MTDQVYDRGPAWWTHSMPCDTEVAVIEFARRFGYTPELIEESKGFLYLGPVTEDTNE